MKYLIGVTLKISIDKILVIKKMKKNHILMIVLKIKSIKTVYEASPV